MSYSFDAIEGRYQSYHSESCALEKQLQMNHLVVGNVGVHLSFLDFPSTNGSSGSMFCINIGNDLRVYCQDNSNPSVDRRFCGGSSAQIRFKVSPTSHCFRHLNDKAHNSQLLIGLSNGEIKLIDPLKEDFNKKSIDETTVTCVGWVPNSPHQFLVSHSNGCIYLYDETLPSLSTPSYTLFKQGIGFSVYTCKTKSTRNPLYRWSLGNTNLSTKTFSKNSHGNQMNGHSLSKPNDNNHGGSDNTGALLINSLFEENNASINQFAFSPCGRFLAIVTEDGYLRVIEYHEMELYGFMRSYFGGLLCVDWSPDGLYIVAGGQDDLITIWSVLDRAVICRGQGHKSWVSMVRFDPFLCPPVEVAGADNLETSRSHSINTNMEDLEHESLNKTSFLSTESNVPKTYRLGSVGHDTMLCLWNLTDDVIREGLKFIRSSISDICPNLGGGDDTSSCVSSSPTQNCQNLTHECLSHKPVMNNALSSINSSVPPLPQNQTGLGYCKLSENKNTINNNNNNNNTNMYSRLFSKKKSATIRYRNIGNNTNNSSIYLSGPPSNGTSSSGSDKSKSIFTLSRGFHWSHSTTSRLSGGDKSNEADVFSYSDGANNANHFWNSFYLGRLSECKEGMLSISENNILGSLMCPRINDVPLLEPLVCIRILKDRVTDLVFRKDTIHIVDQQGLFLAWQRPNELSKDCRSIADDKSNSIRLNDWRSTPTCCKTQTRTS